METQGKKIEIIFQPDELVLNEFDKTWAPKDILAKKEIFFLKDVTRVLKLDINKIKKKAKELQTKGKSSWDIMGTRKVWAHWIVRMKVFAPYYKKHLIPKVQKVESAWDGNTLLNQKGRYLLTDVCRKLPFTSHQIRYQANKSKNAKSEFGLWKDKDLNAFVVDMPKFAPWIKRLWAGNYSA